MCLSSISGFGNTSEELLLASLLLYRSHVLASFWVLALCFRGSNFPWIKLFLILLPPNMGFPAMPLGSAVDILATDDPNFSQEDQQDTQIYEKHDNLLHGTKKKK